MVFFLFEPIFINKTGSDLEKKHGKWIFFETKKHTAPNFSYVLTYDEILPKKFCGHILRWGQRHFCPFVAPARARALYHEKIQNFFFDVTTFKVMQNAVHSRILQVSRSFCCREIALSKFLRNPFFQAKKLRSAATSTWAGPDRKGWVIWDPYGRYFEIME